ncbi:hypothetical protein SPHINGOT1_20183 [Sphingomonas sp. T1]|nr:hypothetical protein SPHINGOT1_20183 [Sphingomonas sp. T1]
MVWPRHEMAAAAFAWGRDGAMGGQGDL